MAENDTGNTGDSGTGDSGDALPEVPEGDYTTGGVPTFDFVRDKIENRFSTSAGATELAGLGTEDNVAELDRKLAENKEAGRDRLAEIRRAMREGG